MIEQHVALIVMILAVIFLLLVVLFAVRLVEPSNQRATLHGWHARVNTIFARQAWVLLLIGALLMVLAACSWSLARPRAIIVDGQVKHQAVMGESFYWAVQTITTVGYGEGFRNEPEDVPYNAATYWMCTTWMIVLGIFWLNVGAHVAGKR